MELENRALSAPRDGAQPKRKRPHEDTKREIEDTTIVSTSSSNDRGGHERRPQSSSAVVTPQKKRKRHNYESEKTVAVYNLPTNSERKTLAGRIKRFILEIRGVEVEVVKCKLVPHLGGKATALVTFRDSNQARLALSLNGIKHAKRTLYARMYDPDLKSKEARGLIKKKQELCILHFLGACSRGNSCIYAHGLPDLRLYNGTVLDQSRCVYINELPKKVKSAQLVTTILNRYKDNKIDAYATYFQHRKSKGDALFEFSNPSHATRASEILNGLWNIGVHRWEPEYQGVFVAHFGRDVSKDTHTEDKLGSDESNRSLDESDNGNGPVPQTIANKSDNGVGYIPHNTTRKEEVPTTITTQPSSKPNLAWPPVEEQRECTPSTGTKVQQDQTLLDLKAAIIDLREELLQAKTNAVTAKEKANDLNWKYRELSQDHTYNLQKMEALEKDNANLNQQQEQSRIRIQELERRLEGAADRNDMYLKDLKDLRGKVQQLENTNRELQRQESVKLASTDSCMELKLKLALSRNERLVKALNEANEKVDQLQNRNFHLRKEKEAMAEELDKSRATKTNRQPTAVEAKVKSEPLT